jgi:hypothetical protein
MKKALAALLSVAFMLGACSSRPAKTTTTAETSLPPSDQQIEAAGRIGIGREELTHLMSQPLYKMQPREVDHYLAYLQATEPSVRNRVAMLARKNIGQPYELYLLGEFPYQVQDDQPLFNLAKSDCVVFVEHTYAMALSRSWDEFFWMLQRIRYRGGVIGVATRNHYTELDWVKENAWLVTDISQEIAGEKAATYSMTVDRQKFLHGRYNVDAQIPVENSVETFVPQDVVPEVVPKLNQGDYVNIISSKANPEKGTVDHWASHVGLVVIAADGTRHILHSSEPKVREETFESFMKRAHDREANNLRIGKKDNKVFAGFKFFRLNENPDVPPMQPQPRPSSAPDKVWNPPAKN